MTSTAREAQAVPEEHPGHPRGKGQAAETSVCPTFHAAIELIGRRWNGVILQRLVDGPLRFSEIRRGVPRLTDAMLSQRLRELEDAGVITREVADHRPVQVSYALTEIGQRLGPILIAVAEWGHEWVEHAPGGDQGL